MLDITKPDRKRVKISHDLNCEMEFKNVTNKQNKMKIALQIQTINAVAVREVGMKVDEEL